MAAQFHDRPSVKFEGTDISSIAYNAVEGRHEIEAWLLI